VNARRVTSSPTILAIAFVLGALLLTAASGQENVKPSAPRTVIQLSTNELIRAYPELKDVEFVPAQEELLTQILSAVGRRVEELFRDFPNTSSRERLHLQMWDQNGTAARAQDKDFQYLLFTKSDRPEKRAANSASTLSSGCAAVQIEEYRTDSKGSEVDVLRLKNSFVVTGGYVSIPLFFHPCYRDDSAFRYIGREKTSRNYVIAFAQIPEKARFKGSFQYLGVPFVFYVHGLAWIDPATGQIVRMRTDLTEPLIGAGLTEQTTEVELAEVRFGETGRTLWLPHEVIVLSRLMGYRFRNHHQYSNYKLFSVDAKEADRKIISPAKPTVPPWPL
jgi:hypothetical protein